MFTVFGDKKRCIQSTNKAALMSEQPFDMLAQHNISRVLFWTDKMTRFDALYISSLFSLC